MISEYTQLALAILLYDFAHSIGLIALRKCDLVWNSIITQCVNKCHGQTKINWSACPYQGSLFIIVKNTAQTFELRPVTISATYVVRFGFEPTLP